jgi:hypothetical protein
VDAEATSCRALVRAFTTMWRNSRIYAPDHPRVGGAVTAALTEIAALRENRGPLLLQVRESTLWVGAASLPITDDDAKPLVERLREVGWRGIEIGGACADGDLRLMLDYLQRQRGRPSEQLLAGWPVDPNHLRPLPLVYDGHFDANAGPDGGSGGTAGPGGGAPGGGAPPAGPRRPGRHAQLAPHVQRVLERLGADPEVRRRLQAVDKMTAAGTAEATVSVDVLERIGALLPADVGADAAAIEGVVRTILERVERDLSEVVRLGARVRGGGLLRLALDVARQFFRTSSLPAAAREGLPTGRPEDDKITADVDLLLAEIEDIPPGSKLNLPHASDLVTAREVLGAFLHTLIHGNTKVATTKLVTMLRDLFGQHGERLSTVLDPYLRGDRKDAQKEAIRLQILRALVEIGGPAVLCARRYIDAQFLAARFPELLPLCARALGGDPAGREVLRVGLERVAQMLSLGGLEAAERSGVLADPVVVDALLAVGGPVARSLLPVIARQATGPALEQVLAHVRTLPLPPLALATLEVAAAGDLPEGHLSRLIVAYQERRPGFANDAESAAILRNNVQRLEDKGELQALLRAIELLRLAPGEETELLLQRLMHRRRLVPWDRRSRAIRATARATRLQLEPRL